MSNTQRTPARGVIVMSAFLGGLAAGGGWAWDPPVAVAQEAAAGILDRTVLPIPEPESPPITELDVRNAKAPPRFEVKAPAGAPNVLIVLIDDMGFGQSSAFGGPIHMPTVGAPGRQAGSGTTSSTPRRSARRPARRCCPAATITCATWARSRRRRPPSRARPGSGPTAWPRWPRCSGSTASPPPPSASRTRPRPGRSASPVRPIAGRPAPASTSSTGSSAARPTSGRRRSTTG